MLKKMCILMKAFSTFVCNLQCKNVFFTMLVRFIKHSNYVLGSSELKAEKLFLRADPKPGLKKMQVGCLLLFQIRPYKTCKILLH